MSYTTNPISNRLKISRGWPIGDFLNNNWLRSSKNIIWFKIYCVLKNFFRFLNWHLIEIQQTRTKALSIIFIKVTKLNKKRRSFNRPIKGNALIFSNVESLSAACRFKKRLVLIRRHFRNKKPIFLFYKKKIKKLSLERLKSFSFLKLQTLASGKNKTLYDLMQYFSNYKKCSDLFLAQKAKLRKWVKIKHTVHKLDRIKAIKYGTYDLERREWENLILKKFKRKGLGLDSRHLVIKKYLEKQRSKKKKMYKLLKKKNNFFTLTRLKVIKSFSKDKCLSTQLLGRRVYFAKKISKLLRLLNMRKSLFKLKTELSHYSRKKWKCRLKKKLWKIRVRRRYYQKRRRNPAVLRLRHSIKRRRKRIKIKTSIFRKVNFRSKIKINITLRALKIRAYLNWRQHYLKAMTKETVLKNSIFVAKRSGQSILQRWRSCSFLYKKSPSKKRARNRFKKLTFSALKAKRRKKALQTKLTKKCVFNTFRWNFLIKQYLLKELLQQSIVKFRQTNRITISSKHARFTANKNRYLRRYKKKPMYIRLIPLFALLTRYWDPQALTDQIAYELRKTKKHWPLLKGIRSLVAKLKPPYLAGYKIAIKGKINAADRTKTFYIKAGQMPLKTFAAKLLFCTAQCDARTGSFSIKTWFYNT